MAEVRETDNAFRILKHKSLPEVPGGTVERGVPASLSLHCRHPLAGWVGRKAEVEASGHCPPGPLGLGRSTGAGSEDPLPARTEVRSAFSCGRPPRARLPFSAGGPASLAPPPLLFLPLPTPSPSSSRPEVRRSPCQHSVPAAALASDLAEVPRRAPRPLGGRPAQPPASAPPDRP